MNVVAAALLLAGCAGATPSTEDDFSPSDPATAAFLREDAEGLARDLGIVDPPEIDTIRIIHLNEWASTQIDCLTEAGYEVGLTEDGEGITYPILAGTEQSTAFNLAVYTCEVQYPVSPKYRRPLTDGQLRHLYDYRTTELIACLEEEGYAIEFVPPSEAVFIQSEGLWSPYEALEGRSGAISAVNMLCPQVPDSLYEID